jgi:hypothetical protein
MGVGVAGNVAGEMTTGPPTPVAKVLRCNNSSRQRSRLKRGSDPSDARSKRRVPGGTESVLDREKPLLRGTFRLVLRRGADRI